MCTYAGDLEISFSAKNFNIIIYIYSKIYNNEIKECHYNIFNIFG